jgi:NMD protein affecting ribosome stability and mRNA decay
MNGLCYFCNTQVETLKHLFYDCTVIQQNWVKIKLALNINIKNYFQFTHRNIFIG